MTDPMDERIDEAQRNLFWLPEDSHIVQREEIDYAVTPSRPERQFNCVTRLRAKPEDYPRLLEEVLRAYEGLPCAWNLGAPSWDEALGELLSQSGFESRATADAYSLDVRTPRPTSPKHIRVERVATAEGILRQHEVMGRSFPEVAALRDDDLARYVSHCTGPEAQVERYIAVDRKSGEALSAGAMTVYRAQKLGFFWGGCTIPEARGRGVYSALVTARLQRARELGLRWIALYALKGTSGPIVAKQGFQKHGKVGFWLRRSPKGKPTTETKKESDPLKA